MSCLLITRWRWIHGHRAELELGDFAVGVQGIVGQDVGRGFLEVEGDEDTAVGDASAPSTEAKSVD